jgi:hypothetical protein
VFKENHLKIMSAKDHLNNEKGSEDEFLNKKRVYFRDEETDEGIEAKRKRTNENEKNQNSGKSDSLTFESENAITRDNVILDDYIFQDPKLEAKFFSFICIVRDLYALSGLEDVGIFNWTIESLVFGLFWFYRVSFVMENCPNKNPLIVQKLKEFKNSVEKIESLTQLDKGNEKELQELDRLLPIIKRFVSESAGKISSDSFISLLEFFSFAIIYDPNRIAKLCLVFMFKLLDKHADVELPMELFHSFCQLSVHDTELRPAFTSEDWWYLYEKSIKYFSQDTLKFILGLLGDHGPYKTRNEIFIHNLRKQKLEPFCYRR